MCEFKSMSQASREAFAIEVAQKTAATVMELTRGPRVNFFRAAETLLYNYKRLALLVQDRSAYVEREPAGSSASIVLNAGRGAGLSLDEQIGDREAEMARLYELTVAQFEQVDRVVKLFADREEFVVIRMYYFGENAEGVYRGDNAERYTWEEIGLLLRRDPKTLRRWRNRMIKDMSVCWWGMAAAVGSAVEAE